MPRSVPELHDLPDELLGAALSFLSLSEGRSVTLVSKRFRRLFYELAPPSIIGSEFELSQFLASKHALLQRVAPLVAEFVVRKPYPEQLTWQLDGSGGHRPLAAFLQQLPPSLTALDLQLQSTLPLQAGQAMQQLAALRSLSLNDVQAADMLPAVLQRMPQLEQLQCSMRSCPDGLASSVCQLSGLTSLFLLVLQGSVPSVQRLTRLSQLRGLTLHQRARLRPPPPSAFPCLQSYEFSADLDGGVELGSMLCRCCKLWDAPLVGGEHPATLRLHGPGMIESFAALLAAAVPPSMTLQTFNPGNVSLSAAALHGCTQLATLHRLVLRFPECDKAAVAALLACSPQLTSLRLMALAQDALESLWRQAPPQLRTLELAVRSLPPELPLLTGLQCLEFNRSGRLELTLADVEVLARLPHLRLLRLSHPEAPNFGVLFPPPPPAFPRLQTFDYSGGADGVVQLAGIRCRRCSLLPNSIADESPTTLVLRGFTAVPGWFADLLAAATPPSVAPEALFLSRVRFSAAALRGCTQLAALRALELSHVSCDDAAAAALFDCVPQLSALSMDVSLAAVNSALFSQPRPQLSRLELYGSLHTSLHSLAPGLSLLSGLQYLDCRCQRSLRLKEDSVELLARLPHLRKLCLAQRTMEKSAAGVL